MKPNVLQGSVQISFEPFSDLIAPLAELIFPTICLVHFYILPLI